jgi:hypothetical protein
MSGTYGSALLEDVFCHVLWRAWDELVIAEREPAGWRRGVGHVRTHAFILGHEALQAIGNSLRIDARFGARPANSHPPPQCKILRARVIPGCLRFLAIGIKNALNRLC